MIGLRGGLKSGQKHVKYRKILKGELLCDRENLERCYYNWAIQEKNLLEKTLKEYSEKVKKVLNLLNSQRSA